MQSTPALELPVYLDHAATTPLAPEVLADMLPFLTEAYGNASALHSLGARARSAVDQARETLADAIGADPEEVYFTSGGTEADNWALKGAAAASGRKHLLVSAVEHHAVLHPAATLGRSGWSVETIPVDSQGRVDPGEVRARLRNDTLLVSVMHANNEVGAIQPVREIGALCRERGVLFHVDAVQSLGKIPVRVREMHADMASFSAHKLYGPKGVGALYLRRGARVAPWMEGGEQERGKRAGTLNVPGIVGFASAVRRTLQGLEEESRRLAALRDRLAAQVLERVPDSTLNGPAQERLPGFAHFCFGGIEGESLLLALDMAGICASAGAACSSGSTEPSHVLLAMGIPLERARGALRLTLGRATTQEAVDYAAARIAEAVAGLRSMGSLSLA